MAALLSVLPGCVFCPNVEQYGYTACESDDECEVGRYCDANLCAPPPWNDDTMGRRQMLVVKNESDVTIEKGTAVPVAVGPDGVLALDDVKADGRFTDYSRKTGEWRIVPVYRDREDDRFTTWIPLSRSLPKKSSDVLAWVESERDDKKPTIVEEPAEVFRVFDSFDGEVLDDAWLVTSAGGLGPRVEDGAVNVGDNQALVHQTVLRPPLSATFVMRVNGVDCDEVFVGVVGNDEAIFNDPPTAGLFVESDLAATFQVGPEPDSFAQAVGDPFEVSASYMRVTVAVDRNRAHLVIDGTDRGSNDLRPPFADDARMFLALQVGGSCSIDVDAVWETPLPSPAPSVKAGDIVQLRLLF